MREKKSPGIVVANEWDPSEFVEPALRGYGDAERRLGDNRSRLSWLLDFVYLTAEEITELCSDPRKQFLFDLAYIGALSEPWRLPSLHGIAALASYLKSGIEEFRRYLRWTIRLPLNAEVERTIEPRPKRRLRRTRLVGFQSIFTSNDFRTSFLLRATDAIEEEGARINVCARKDCGRMFARHRRAKYCQPELLAERKRCAIQKSPLCRRTKRPAPCLLQEIRKKVRRQRFGQ